MAREVGGEGGGGPDRSPQFDTYKQSRDPNDRANLPGNRPATNATPWTPKAGRDYYTMPEELKAWTSGAGAFLSGIGNVARGAVNFVGDTLQSSVWDATHPFASKAERERRTTTRIEGGGNPLDWYKKRGKTTLGQQLSDAAAVGLALGAPEAAAIKAGVQLKNAKTAANAVRDLKKTEDIVKAITEAPVKTVGSGKTGVVTARGRTVRGEGLPNVRGASAATAGAGKGDGTGKGTGTGKGDGTGRGTGTGKGMGTGTGKGDGTGKGSGRGEGPEGKPSTSGGTATMERPRDFTPPAKEKLKPVPGFGGPSGTGGTPELLEDIKLGLGTTGESQPIQFNQPTPVTVPTSTTRPTSATQPTVSSIPKTETKASTTNPTTTSTRNATGGGGGGGGGGKPKKRFTGSKTSFSGSEQELRRAY